jgi:hypothetical protein
VQQSACLALPLTEAADDFYVAASVRLLALPPGRKGRYAPLAALLPSLGARRLLALRPGAFAEALTALQDDGVASSVAAFIKACCMCTPNFLCLLGLQVSIMPLGAHQ